MEKYFNWIPVVTLLMFALFSGRIEGQTETTIGCDKQEVRYSPIDSSVRGKITLAETKDSLTPSSTTKRSPQGTRYASLDGADFSKPGPWSTAVFIGGVGLNGHLLKLSFVDHANGGVQMQWLNEKLLFVQVWWGRIVSTDIILDVSSKTVLYEEMAQYGEMIQACH